MVDELRFPPVYENSELRNWRLQYLKSQNILRTNAMEFKRHYVSSTACAPSRTTLFTGQYPSLHGVKQTNGIAKISGGNDFHWLDENTVPTMGHYFQQSGYKTYYKGKWHLSDEDIIIPGTNKSLGSFDPMTGVPNKEYTELYLNANRLQKYGFNGWIGPEPHGADPNNSASSAKTHIGGRDVIYMQDVIELLKQLEESNDNMPWLVVASFLNPHDIVLFGDFTENLPIFNFQYDPSVPYIPSPPTHNEDLSTKPIAHKSYQETYPKALQSISNGEKYRRLYYSLEKNVDDQIYEILEFITKSPMYKDTIIIFTSDHGDQLGAHGLHQKWHNMYEESIHVPLIIHSPKLFQTYNFTEELTTHVDLLPTMLALANINENAIREILRIRHLEVRPLVGKKLSLDSCQTNHIDECLVGTKRTYGIFCDQNEEKYLHSNIDAIYFWTQDNPTNGPNQTNIITGQEYLSVSEPNSIEAIIVYLPMKNKSIVHLYKYARYYDPNSTIVPEEYEMYNLTIDPLETKNLINPMYTTPEIQSIRMRLDKILVEERIKKLLTPRSI